ncbi:MAG: penicillin-binding transpeptidase domain-containing protein [Mycobacteriales bacterium]
MNDTARRRLVVMRVLVLSLVATLFGRLWYLQVLAGDSYASIARKNQIRQIITPAPRGWILDDQGRPLVRNKTALVVSVSRTALLAQPDGGTAVLRRLAGAIGMPLAQLQDRIRLCAPHVAPPCYNGSPYQPVPIAEYDSTNQQAAERALAIEEQRELFPGVTVGLQAVRDYPYGSLAGHELGYLTPITQQELALPAYQGYSPTELIGATGLEYTYQRYLRGQPGVKEVTVDSGGTVTGTVSTTPPVSGDDLVLNLDAGVQQALVHDLQGAIAETESHGHYGDSAAGVVMNVHTGAVIAMASAPNYDPAQFTGGISQAAYNALSSTQAGVPLLSRAYQSAYPPGSTFKVVSTSAIFQAGLAGFYTRTPCPPSLQIGTSTLHNAGYESAPPLTLAGAIRISCDTVFYHFGYQQWIADGGLRNTPAELAHPAQEIFVKMAHAYGLGKPTGIDLPGETGGLVGGRQYNLAYWKANRTQFCLGATRHPNNPGREALDAYNCQYGFLSLPGEAAQFVIGQSSDLLISPLQLADVYCTVANGGTILAPLLAKALIAPDGRVVKRFGPVIRGHVPVTAADLAYIRGALKQVVQAPGGTGFGAGFPLSLDAGGKTGTASNNLTGNPDAWFASVQPIDNPKYVIVIEVSHAGYGASSSAPAVADLYKQIYGIGSPAIFPGGQAPTALPVIHPDGAITSPLAKPAPVSPMAPQPGGRSLPPGYALAPVGLGLLGRRRRRRRTGRAPG